MSLPAYDELRLMSSEERKPVLSEYYNAFDHMDDKRLSDKIKAEEFTFDFLNRVDIEVNTHGHTLSIHALSDESVHDAVSKIIFLHSRMGSAEDLFDKEYNGKKYMHLYGCFDRLICDCCAKTFRDGYFSADGELILIEANAYFNSAGKLESTSKPMEICEYADGFPPYSVEIDIPSGTMMLANRFYGFDEWEGEDPKQKYSNEYNICQVYGCKKTTELNASKGMINMNIGNCGCDMFQTDETKTKFMVGYDYSEVESEFEAYTKVGEVITDYWGYHIMDADKVSELGLEYEQDDIHKVECVAGRYRFTHRYHLLTEDDDACVYTEIERIGDVSDV
jgi:hypothetical protein